MDRCFAAVCGVKNSGKTTLLEKLIRELTARGLKTAVIKHDGHEFVCDIPGTDSFRYVEAGACGAAVFSRGQVMVRRLGEFPPPGGGTPTPQEKEPAIRAFLEKLARSFPDADVILAEGLKELPVPKIEVVRSRISRSPVSNPRGRFLVVSDLPEDRIGEKTLPFEDTAGIADRILRDGRKTSMDISMDILQGKESSGEMLHKTGRPAEDFTHFDETGRARMVNVGDKAVTRRTAVAEGRVIVNSHTFELIKSGGMKKGDVLGTAQVAGIMGAKRTSDLIPMCHPLFLSGIRLDLTLNEQDCAVDIRAEVSCEGKTGVEMEALTAVSTAALTVYDMCKAVQRDMEITAVRLVQKTGGIHGDYRRD